MGIAGNLKESIKTILHKRQSELYAQEYLRQSDRYRQWYLLKEADRTKNIAKKLPSVGSVDDNSEIVLYTLSDGSYSSDALILIGDYFKKHPETELLYAEEDLVKEDGTRYDPWFKPEWSPDTFESFNYFGSFFAIRRRWVLAYDHGDVLPFLYQVTKEITKEYLKMHPDISIGQIPSTERSGPIAHLDQVLFHKTGDWEDNLWPFQIRKQPSSPGTLSIVIPSKDNPDVLKNCIESISRLELTEKTLSYEIVVIDNGSSQENRQKTEQLSKQFAFTYLYEPMEFNFSVMSNLGARKSKGEYLLFLNDDVEIREKGTLGRLYEFAKKPHVGAVGAKLLFPDTDLIQHAGITNLDVGPAHKLLKMTDKISQYHGHNRFAYDMIGVTAACLMVRRTVFDEVGGFCEDIKVSYNDVDLCFKIIEHGLYNVCCNDISLWHHESLSRGDDNLSDEKWERLLLEKDLLYRRHPGMERFDPFYGRNLAQHLHDYRANFLYECEKRDNVAKTRPYPGSEPIEHTNGCLMVTIERSHIRKKLDLNEKWNSFWIEGWSYVLNMDNCHYDRSILLIGEKQGIYEAQVCCNYRQDVADILPEQKNVELAGFVCGIPIGTLPPDTYTVAMLAKDKCTRQKLYCVTEAKLHVEPTDIREIKDNRDES